MSGQPMDKAGWQSVRTVIEALILAALLWCGKTLITTGQQMAVMTNQLDTVAKQLSGVPEMNTKVIELKVRVDQHDQDIRELKQLRGVK